MELTITPYNGIKYSDGIAGGRFSKLAAKLPNLVTVKILDVCFEPRPKALLIQSTGESVGIDAFIVLLELLPKFSIQLLN
jgi:hypothetical protein